MSHRDNYTHINPIEKHGTKINGPLALQEKFDGSNLSFVFDVHTKSWRTFSRHREIPAGFNFQKCLYKVSKFLHEKWISTIVLPRVIEKYFADADEVWLIGELYGKGIIGRIDYRRPKGWPDYFEQFFVCFDIRVHSKEECYYISPQQLDGFKRDTEAIVNLNVFVPSFVLTGRDFATIQDAVFIVEEFAKMRSAITCDEAGGGTKEVEGVVVKKWDGIRPRQNWNGLCAKIVLDAFKEKMAPNNTVAEKNASDSQQNVCEFLKFLDDNARCQKRLADSVLPDTKYPDFVNAVVEDALDDFTQDPTEKEVLRANSKKLCSNVVKKHVPFAVFKEHQQ